MKKGTKKTTKKKTTKKPTTKNTVSNTKVTERLNTHGNKIAHLYDMNAQLRRGLSTVYNIWDGIIKTVGTVLGVVILFFVYILGRNIYLLDGKWPFLVAVLGVVIFLFVVYGVFWIWTEGVNKLLVNRDYFRSLRNQ